MVGRDVSTYADPFYFLALRFACVALIFAAAALAARVAWPRGPRRVALHLAAGALMSGLYLGPGWWAMGHGLADGVMALIGALQPLFTALISVLVLRQRLSARTWAGLVLGLGGVALVLWPRLQAGAAVGGATLLIWLMRHGEATRTAALMLIVPPLSALQSWAFLGETLTLLQMLGFALAIAGVQLARRG